MMSQEAKKNELRGNSRALRNHVTYMVSLATQHTPELLTHPGKSASNISKTQTSKWHAVGA